MELRRFQQRFLRRALARGIRTAALSVARGNGKSALAAFVLAKCMSPGDRLHQSGAEYLLNAASLEQARNVYRPLRAALEPMGGYRFIDSVTRLGITHVPTNTKLRVMSSSGKHAFGIVGCPLLVADEPGSWEVAGGTLMYDAIQTAQGKPDSPLRVLYIGTLAPSISGWWHDLIDGGSHGGVYVQALRGDRAKWDKWPEIRRCNPLMAAFPESRKVLLDERDAARADSRLKARFLSYRLNVPTADEATTLLTVSDWERMARRETPAREGQPIVAVDLGAGRAWSAAVAVWRTGRVEALALAPGIPDLEAQERRDRVHSGTYRTLAAGGQLTIDVGLRVQRPSALWTSIVSTWGVPVGIVCDRYRLGELQDAVKGTCGIEPRVTRWSEASFDIRSLRKGIKDGPLAVDPESRGLVAGALAAATVKNDDQGSVRLVKRGHNNEARDDVAAALVLAAGAYARAEARPSAGVRHVVVQWARSTV